MTLELWSGPGDTLADALVRSAQARTLADLVADAKKHADMALEDKVAEVQQATGTAFTARGDGGLRGWSALVTAPQPKPHVTDRDRFASWWVDNLPDAVVRERVEVIDHDRLAQAITYIFNRSPNTNTDDPSGAVELTGRDAEELERLLVESAKVVSEVLLPEGALDRLAEPRFAITADAVVDTDTGEQVPGVTVTRQAPRLQVRGDAKAKAKARRDLASRLGIPAEIAGGDDG